MLTKIILILSHILGKQTFYGLRFHDLFFLKRLFAFYVIFY